MEFFRQEYWSGLPFPLQGIFPTQGSNLHLLLWQADSVPLCHLGSPERGRDLPIWWDNHWLVTRLCHTSAAGFEKGRSCWMDSVSLSLKRHWSWRRRYKMWVFAFQLWRLYTVSSGDGRGMGKRTWALSKSPSGLLGSEKQSPQSYTQGTELCKHVNEPGSRFFPRVLVKYAENVLQSGLVWCLLMTNLGYRFGGRMGRILQSDIRGTWH